MCGRAGKGHASVKNYPAFPNRFARITYNVVLSVIVCFLNVLAVLSFKAIHAVLTRCQRNGQVLFAEHET